MRPTKGSKRRRTSSVALEALVWASIDAMRGARESRNDVITRIVNDASAHVSLIRIAQLLVEREQGGPVAANASYRLDGHRVAVRCESGPRYTVTREGGLQAVPA